MTWRQRLSYVYQRAGRQKLVTQADTHTGLHRCLSTLQMTAIGIGSTIGVGIYVLLGVAIRDYAGPGVLLSFLLAGFVVLTNALIFMEFGSYIPHTGAAYTYIYRSVGELAAFLTGWMGLLSLTCSAATGARAWSGFVDSLFNNSIQHYLDQQLGQLDLGPPFSRSLDWLALTFFLLVTAVVSCHVRCSSLLTTGLAVLTTLVLVLVSVAGPVLGDIRRLADTHTGGFLPYGLSGVLTGASAAFFAFNGYDSICLSAEEAVDPARSVPRAILLELLVVTVVYCGAALGTLCLIPYTHIDLRAPIPSAFAYQGVTWAQYVVTIGPILAISNLSILGLYAASRICYRMAQDGLLMARFSYISPTTKVPLLGVVVFGVLVAIMSLLLELKDLVRFSVVCMLFQYILLAPALVALRAADSDRQTLELRAADSHRQTLELTAAESDRETSDLRSADSDRETSDLRSADSDRQTSELTAADSNKQTAELSVTDKDTQIEELRVADTDGDGQTPELTGADRQSGQWEGPPNGDEDGLMLYQHPEGGAWGSGPHAEPQPLVHPLPASHPNSAGDREGLVEKADSRAVVPTLVDPSSHLNSAGDREGLEGKADSRAAVSQGGARTVRGVQGDVDNNNEAKDGQAGMDTSLMPSSEISHSEDNGTVYTFQRKVLHGSRSGGFADDSHLSEEQSQTKPDTNSISPLKLKTNWSIKPGEGCFEITRREFFHLLSTKMCLCLLVLVLAALAVQLAMGWEDLRRANLLAVLGTTLMAVVIVFLCEVVRKRCGPGHHEGFKVPLVPYVPMLSCFLNMLLLVSAADMTGIIEFAVLVSLGLVIYVIMTMTQWQKDDDVDRRLSIQSGESYALLSQEDNDADSEGSF